MREGRFTRGNAAPLAPAAPKQPLAERKLASNMCALAVLGGRFAGGVVEALKHPEFADATEHYTRAALKEMQAQPGAQAVAEAAEAERLAQVEAEAAAERTNTLDVKRKDDPEYVESMFSERLLVAAEAGVELSKAEVATWAALFDGSDEETLRAWSYRFQFASWAGVVDRAGEKQPRGNASIKALAVLLFGEKAAWSERSITDAVKGGDNSPKQCGRPPSYPKELEEELLAFVRRLRELTIRVDKWTVMDYAMRLISTHEASLSFAHIGPDGEYVQNAELGGFEWDPVKLDNWYYRRFLGDHPELTTGRCRVCRAPVSCCLYVYQMYTYRGGYDLTFNS